MTNKEVYRKWLIRAMVVTLIFSAFFAYYYMNRMIPNQIHLVQGETGRFNFQLPLRATLQADSEEVVLGGVSNIPEGELHVTLNEGFTMQAETCGEYTVSLDLFGIFHLKDIAVSVLEEGYVIPCGVPVGIYLETDGILVVGTSEVTKEDGTVVEPAAGILKSGDYILAINGQELPNKDMLAALVAQDGAKPVVLDIRREGKEMQVEVAAALTSDGYKMGVWVRDDLQGIGTLTYIDQEGNFGTLGHGISDVDTGLVVEADAGTLYAAKINSVIRGTTGVAGSLSGVILYGQDNAWGDIDRNTTEGVFGEVYEVPDCVSDVEWLPIGYRQDVTTGLATVRCTVDGEVNDYEIKILRCDPSDRTNKSLVIEVTDPALLSKTGGIVQGLSGSPILQHGKVIGAVTHVFLQNSARGYGIYLETMLEQQNQPK